ncbi:MAG: hypothetical protein HYZ81_04640 [Nitrospinae bacterium]|nr:hypothetical protein [Nitrospinota bacterium]
MAEEALVMTKETLTKEMIQAGAELTRRLDAAGLVVSASFWLYIPEANLWRLLIVSPEVSTAGPKKVYQKIQSVLPQIPEIALQDISVVEQTNPLVSLLRTAVRTGEGISGIRFSKNTINGHFIEDVYIYRMS